MDNDMLTCKKCLLYEMPDANRFQNMYDYIANLDEDVKVTDGLYQKRLSVCKECDQLLAGMCRICGCYVEMRAVMKQRNCPAVDAKW